MFVNSINVFDCCLSGVMHEIAIIEQTLKEDHPRISPVKFGQNPPSCLEKRYCLKQVVGRRTDNRHSMITKAFLKPREQSAVEECLTSDQGV